jgi:hypothetical protein
VLRYLAKVRDLPRDELRNLIRTELGPELERTMTSTYDQPIHEGLAQGRAEAILELLEKRCGPLPTDLVGRIRTANVAQLDEWLLRILDTHSVEDVIVQD